MKKRKITATRTAAELAKALGLTPADGAEIALRSDLNSKIVEVVQRKGLTHAQVARLARTSRTRVTAIMKTSPPISSSASSIPSAIPPKSNSKKPPDPSGNANLPIGVVSKQNPTHCHSRILRPGCCCGMRRLHS